MKNIMFTGGSGLLGSEMVKLYPDSLFPTSQEVNISFIDDIYAYIKKMEVPINTIVHMAAFTSPPKVEEDPAKAISTNIIGTANIVKACIDYGIRLIYISTDYVFDGEKGYYKEEDAVNPNNKYALSKLGGECSVRMYKNSVVIRLSFGPNEFPYDGAFIDQWTSREKVSDIAVKVKNVINSSFTGIIHIGSERRTVYEYAKSVTPDKELKKISIKYMKVPMPKDTSLDVGKYKKLSN